LDTTQIRHARAMAEKIKGHVLHMQMRMRNLTDAKDSDYQHVPVENVESTFEDLENDWNEIQSVIRDMLPDLKPIEDVEDLTTDYLENGDG